MQKISEEYLVYYIVRCFLNILVFSLTFFSHNPVQNILRAIKRSSKVRLHRKLFASVCAYVISVSANDSLLQWKCL